MPNQDHGLSKQFVFYALVRCSVYRVELVHFILVSSRDLCHIEVFLINAVF